LGFLQGTAPDANGGYYDVYSTLSSQLLLSERSMNDPAFQYETRDQEAIERALYSLPGREAWRLTSIEIDGRPKEFMRQDRGTHWVAFHDLGGECILIHVEESDETPISIATIGDSTVYLTGAV